MSIISKIFKKKKGGTFVGNVIRKISGKPLPSKDAPASPALASAWADAQKEVKAYQDACRKQGIRPSKDVINKIRSKHIGQAASSSGLLQAQADQIAADNATLQDDILDMVGEFANSDGGRAAINTVESLVKNAVNQNVVDPLAKKLAEGSDSSKLINEFGWQYIKAWVSKNWWVRLILGGFILWALYRVTFKRGKSRR